MLIHRLALLSAFALAFATLPLCLRAQDTPAAPAAAAPAAVAAPVPAVRAPADLIAIAAALPRPKWIKSVPETPEGMPALYGLGASALKANAARAADAARLFEQYRREAEAGNAVAQVSLGRLYDNGVAVAESKPEALKWFRRAADQGDAAAQSALATMYRNGEGIAKDEAEALRWYRKSADQGFAAAITNLGYIHEAGVGVAKDMAEALKFYRAAADLGEPYAQKSMARIHRFGLAGPVNLAEAVRWYRLAAEQGDADGQATLGYLYQVGQGVARNGGEALKLYRLAADQGDAFSLCRMGEIQEAGVLGRRDEAEALRLFQAAAKKEPERCKQELARLQGMKYMEAIEVLRQTGGLNAGWASDDKFVVAKTEVSCCEIKWLGAASGSLTLGFASSEARIETIGGRTTLLLAKARQGGELYLAMPDAGDESRRRAQRLLDALQALRQWGVYLFTVDLLPNVVYTGLAPRPEPGEEVRRYLVQAQSAVRDKSFKEATMLLAEAVRLAPWSPVARYNLALALGEIGAYSYAVIHMNQFLALAPDAPQARSAQDQVYEWERKAKQP